MPINLRAKINLVDLVNITDGSFKLNSSKCRENVNDLISQKWKSYCNSNDANDDLEPTNSIKHPHILTST